MEEKAECGRCGEELPDRKFMTMWNHLAMEHEEERERIEEIVNNNFVFVDSDGSRY